MAAAAAVATAGRDSPGRRPGGGGGPSPCRPAPLCKEEPAGRAEPGGGGRPGWGGATRGHTPGLPRATQHEGAWLGPAGPALQPCSCATDQVLGSQTQPGESGALLSHAHILPTRFRLVQPKEGNERPEGRDNFGPTHLEPADHPEPQRCRGGARGWKGGAGPSRRASRVRAPPLPTPSCGALSARVWQIRAIATAAFIITQGRIPTLPGAEYPRLC